jgi:hypothetical protein
MQQWRLDEDKSALNFQEKHRTFMLFNSPSFLLETDDGREIDALEPGQLLLLFFKKYFFCFHKTDLST